VSAAVPGRLDARAILVSARTRLADPDRWLHDGEHEAVDARGYAVVLPWDEAAVRWTVDGALSAAQGGDRATNEALRLLCDAAGLSSPTDVAPVDWLAFATWHDAPERTHEEVLTVLDAAIAAAPPEAS